MSQMIFVKATINSNYPP